MTRTCLDLCSGLGGFSEAFLRRGWDVVRIDNDPKFADVPNTVIMDVRDIAMPFGYIDGRADVILASPPCTCFTGLTNRWGTYWDAEGHPKPKAVQAIRIVMWCLDAIDLLKPKYWILENPTGRLRRILGKPQVQTWHGSWGSLHLKPTDLWGVFPSKIDWHKPTKDFISITHGGDKISPKDSADRAKIPYALSEAICIACERELGA